jgi:glycosyltransferase involved in cell wall biosynthesis
MKTILFIHQSAELYGSDKTLLLLLQNLDRARYRPVVVLPGSGPLHDALESEGIIVVTAPVLKLYRKMFTPGGLVRFFADIRKAYKVLNRLNKEYHFDLVYSNTLAVLLGFFYAKRKKLPHLWHVHEIIERPAFIRKALTAVLASPANSVIVHNSEATCTFWSQHPAIAKRSRVVLNGIDTIVPVVNETEIQQIRQQRLHLAPDEKAIALVGRISRWKGQGILLDAFSRLAPRYPKARLLYVGSPPPGQEHFLYSLEAEIERLGLKHRVVLLPFQEDIVKIWQAIDIAVVPSTEPEPFGMVAIEAMLAGKPVVASAHGGLTEIVKDGVTGCLVPAGDPEALAAAIETLLKDSETATKMGIAGRKRIVEEFSVQQYAEKLSDIFKELTEC